LLSAHLLLLQAIDAVQFEMITDFSFVRNKVAAPVSDVVFRVAAWGGGLATGAGKLIEGQFRCASSNEIQQGCQWGCRLYVCKQYVTVITG